MSATHSVLYLETDGTVRLKGLKNEDDAYQNDATVTLETIVDRATELVEVTGITFPLSMTYVAGSNGDYEANIPNNTDMELNTWYIATVKAISAEAGNPQRVWKETLKMTRSIA